MKRIALISSVVLAICASPVGALANGCGTGFSFGFWPFFGFGIGFGLGASCGYPAYGCYSYPYSYPAYAYSPPSYTYSPVYNTYTTSAPSQAPAPAPAPQVQQPDSQSSAPLFSSPGVGHWVPDPQPYSYTPQAVLVKTPPATAPPPGTTVNLAVSTGGVPVYAIHQ